ncbi:MAG TPA: sodium:solute symporter [Kiritimatiellia bacterium]|nr:sodium:solute symporter [Kiritimatiellia bacterium]HPS07242.1 sodium:solute symporter [Kiritimatiellia bacterium]
MSIMAPLDWAVVAGYFAVLAAVVILTRRAQNTSEDFFLGGRSVGWLAIGASIFAANIGSEHVIGLAGQGARTGLSMAHWEFHAWVLVLMAWVFLPFYYNSGVQTMPEFLERRFGPRARWILSLVSLAAYVLTKISVTVFAGALFFEVMLPELSFKVGETVVSSFWIGAFTTVTLAGVYASFGGLLAVVYTDLVQTGIILAGSLCVTFFSLSKLGSTVENGTVFSGWGVLKATLKAKPEVVDAFSLWHPLSHPTLPWLGVVVASITIGVWYWCTDQFIIQRTLSARNMTHARRGALWGGLLKLTPVFIFLVPGMLGYALHEHGLIRIPLDKAGGIDSDKVFPTLVTSLLPTGFRGLVVAGLVAALMSSLASLFNSVATLFTVDVYKKLHAGVSERWLVHIGRITTVVMTGLGLVWVPIMKAVSGGGLYQYIQSVQSFLAPPIVAVFLLGLCWKRSNLRGAVWGLSLGFFIGMAKLTVNALFRNGTPGTFMFRVANFQDFYFSGILLLLSLLIVAVSSLTAPAPDETAIKGACFSTLDAEYRRANRASWNKVDVVASCVVVGLVICAYAYFWTWLK